jgi:uncharacterized protein DUF5666
MTRHMFTTKRLATMAVVSALTAGLAGTTTAGIQGSGFRGMAAVGRILQVSGGLIVNGVTYSTSGARVSVDGQASTLSQLQPGDVVTISGSVSNDGTTAIADEIAFVGDVRGVITANDPQNGTLTVMNQTVRLSGDTVIDDAAGLTVGSAVEVTGFANSAGELVASRVDPQAHAQKGQVRGTVAALDANGHTFQINSLLVDYDKAQVDGALANGAIVTVESKSESANGLLVAKSVDVSDALGAAGAQGDLQGLITSFASAAEFAVNGQRVIGDEHTQYDLRSSVLGPDVEVIVSGRFNASGALVADSVEITKKAAKAQAKAAKDAEKAAKKKK